MRVRAEEFLPLINNRISNTRVRAHAQFTANIKLLSEIIRRQNIQNLNWQELMSNHQLDWFCWARGGRTAFFFSGVCFYSQVFEFYSFYFLFFLLLF